VAGTLEEIARLSGVSRSTVSRVINDDARVSPATRARVLAVVEREGYRPNLTARRLASGRANVLGVVIPLASPEVLSDPYFSKLLHGIAVEADARDQHVMLSLAEPSFRHRIDEVASQGIIDGVIFSAAQAGDPFMGRLVGSGTRFVGVGRIDDPNVSYVDIDNVASARQATAHLLRLGRRRVATVTGPLYATAAIDRLSGYREALEHYGIDFDPDLVVQGDFTEAGGRAGMQRLLEHRPDAVFAASDRMAAGVLNELRSSGVRIPEDTALVGFDDIPLALQMEPPLTTVRQQIESLGAAAVNLLLDLIDDPSATGRRVILPSELVVRVSCGAHLNQERKAIDATT
jgi:LacI family transcriptional regulator